MGATLSKLPFVYSVSQRNKIRNGASFLVITYINEYKNGRAAINVNVSIVWMIQTVIEPAVI